METLVLLRTEELKTLIIDSVNLCLRYNKTSTELQQKEEELLTIKEAANFLKYSVPSIYRLVSENKIPHFKKGSKLLFKKDELTAWLNEGRRKTVTEISNDAERHLEELGQKKRHATHK